ncbi:MAG: lysophospholipase L1-like esterase [Verrucomicrobia bacterium]|jgi:acyl-CoA thioesterase-1|nr:lysophospholipase L1-like esterase [Verrucomicrobiota bacterium]
MARLHLIRAGVWTLAMTVLFMLADNLPAADTAAPKSVLILGDSLAAGYGITREEAFPALLQKKIETAKLPYRIVNGGVSGDTTAGGLRRIDWMLKQPADVLIVELGGNDGLRGIPPAETKKNLQGIIDKAKQKYPQIRIIVAGMQMPPNMGEDYTKAFAEVFPSIAQANKATLIPFLLEGVGGQADLNQPDGIHPTPKGHQVVAENVWKVLEPVLK